MIKRPKQSCNPVSLQEIFVDPVCKYCTYIWEIREAYQESCRSNPRNWKVKISGLLLSVARLLEFGQFFSIAFKKLENSARKC